MRRPFAACALLVPFALMLAAPSARAQGSRAGETPVAPLRSVSGSVYDAATGVPIPRGSACVYFPVDRAIRSRCANFDGGGNFRLDSLPARRDTLYLACASPQLLRTLEPVRVPLDLSARDSFDVAIPIAAAGCDTSRAVAITGEFEGIYTIGFESSRFEPCDGGPSAWVVILPDSSGARPRRWPKPNDRYYPTYYVRWRGTRTGPGHYGHMGVSPYLLTVTRVLEVRRAGKHDCR